MRPRWELLALCQTVAVRMAYSIVMFTGILILWGIFVSRYTYRVEDGHRD